MRLSLRQKIALHFWHCSLTKKFYELAKAAFGSWLSAGGIALDYECQSWLEMKMDYNANAAVWMHM